MPQPKKQADIDKILDLMQEGDPIADLPVKRKPNNY